MKWRACGLSVVLTSALAMVGVFAAPAGAEYDPPHRAIVFPVAGGATFRNDWGNCRDNCTRNHQGNDLFAPKHTPVVAAFDGVITNLVPDTVTIAGVNLTIRADDGWAARYVHINNDNYGTNDNAAPPELRFAPGVEVGARVVQGQTVAFVGNSGNAENSAPHLHFELYRPGGAATNPYESLRLAIGQRGEIQCSVTSNPYGTPSNDEHGYWVLGTDGGVFTYGAAPYYGSTGGMRLNTPALQMAARPQGDGYWFVAGDGGIFSFGAAQFFGSMGATPLNQPIVGMASTPSGLGYWLVARDGGIFSFGDAEFFGSTGAMVLNQPIVGMTPTPSGDGYWLVAADGGIFSFGDAAFFGSTGAMVLAQPIIAMAARPQGDGYWMVARDGGVFAFGAAGYYGSLPGLGRCQWEPAVALAVSRSGHGYLITSADGTVRAFGDARDDGDPSDFGVRAAGLARR